MVLLMKSHGFTDDLIADERVLRRSDLPVARLEVTFAKQGGKVFYNFVVVANYAEGELVM